MGILSLGMVLIAMSEAPYFGIVLNSLRPDFEIFAVPQANTKLDFI